MINIDLTDAYLSVPIHQESQKFLRFIWQNKAYQFKAMPFGLNVAPRVFTKLLKPVVAWLRGQGIRLIIYLDDILIMASSVELVKQHKQITIRLLESLGFLINYDKSMLIPTQRIQFLGLLIDSTQMLFILPETKTTSIRKACQQLVNKQRPTIREVSRVLGLHSQKRHRLAASCEFYPLAASCQQVAASLLTSSSCSKSVKSDLLQLDICRLAASCCNNLQQACGQQVLTSLIEQLAASLLNASMLMQAAKIRLVAT